MLCTLAVLFIEDSVWSSYICFWVNPTAVRMAFVSSDDMNWNALEWDRAAEELTWERVSRNNFLELFLSGLYLMICSIAATKSSWDIFEHCCSV